MTDETRRRQKREELTAKAKKMQQVDRMKLFIESRRTIKGPYSPEALAAKIRSLFGDEKRTETFGK